MTKRKTSAYAAAGVDIDNKMRALTAIKKMVRLCPRQFYR